MRWKELPLWLKIESTAFLVISFALIVLAFSVAGGDLNIASALFLAFIPISIFWGIWVLSVSILNKSWKFFFYGGSPLVLIWLVFWILSLIVIF